MMAEFEVNRSLQLSTPFVVGEKELTVVAETLLMKERKGNIFGLLVSPVYLIVRELDQSYAFSLPEGTGVDLENLFLKNPSLKEKSSQNKS
jgi:hypothetical protein